MAQQPQQQPAPQEQPSTQQQEPADQTARMQAPPQPRPTPNFNSSMTAGSAIEQAARAAAESRGIMAAANLGITVCPAAGMGAKALDQAEILTDTMGVDFGPYLTRVVQIVRQNWYKLDAAVGVSTDFEARQAFD